MPITKYTRYAGLALLSVSIFIFSTWDTAAAQKGKVLRFAYTYTEDNPIHKAAVMFASKMKERTNGRIIVELYPSGQIGKEKELVEQSRLGTLDMGLASDGNLTDYTPSTVWMGLPYLFGSREELDNFLIRSPRLRQEHEMQFEKETGFKLLMMFGACGGPRRIVHKGKTVIKVPGDMKGIKIRATGDPAMVALLRAWGASPTPIPWSEVYSAIQQNVVDATYNEYFSAFESKFFEVSKGVTEVSANWVISHVWMTSKVFNSFSPADQKIIVETAREAEAHGEKLNVDLDNWTREQVLKAGAKVYVPTSEEELEWRLKAVETWDQFVGPKLPIIPSKVGKLLQMHIALLKKKVAEKK